MKILITFLWVGFSVLVKMKNKKNEKYWDCKSSSTLATFCKIPSRRIVFSNARVFLCNGFGFFGKAELFLHKKRFLFLISKFFVLLCFDWLKTFLNWFFFFFFWIDFIIDVNIWMWTHNVKGVMKLGSREQIYYMKFMEVCILAVILSAVSAGQAVS